MNFTINKRFSMTGFRSFQSHLCLFTAAGILRDQDRCQRDRHRIDRKRFRYLHPFDDHSR